MTRFILMSFFFFLATFACFNLDHGHVDTVPIRVWVTEEKQQCVCIRVSGSQRVCKQAWCSQAGSEWPHALLCAVTQSVISSLRALAPAFYPGSGQYQGCWKERGWKNGSTGHFHHKFKQMRKFSICTLYVFLWWKAYILCHLFSHRLADA